jgi:hypothetical protein
VRPRDGSRQKSNGREQPRRAQRARSLSSYLARPKPTSQDDELAVVKLCLPSLCVLCGLCGLLLAQQKRPVLRTGLEQSPELALPAKDAYGAVWYPDFRVNLLAAAFPPFGAVAIRAAFVVGHSGGAVPEFHRLPSNLLRINPRGGFVKGPVSG